MFDGQRVSYIGSERQGIALGDRGEVLSASDRASHVLWHTGAVKGQVLLVDHYDLAPVGKQAQAAVVDDGLDDSLEVGGLGVTATRVIFDDSGETGLLNAMAEQGHLASFAAIAEEAQTLISTRIRNDPSFRAVTAQLDDEEGESLVRLATSVLLRDAFDLGD